MSWTDQDTLSGGLTTKTREKLGINPFCEHFNPRRSSLNSIPVFTKGLSGPVRDTRRLSSVTYLVEHHELGPGSLDVVGIEVSVQLEVHVSHLALKIFEDGEEFFLFSQPGWNFFYSKSIWIFSQALHFNKCIGEVTVLRIVEIFLIKI